MKAGVVADGAAGAAAGGVTDDDGVGAADAVVRVGAGLPSANGGTSRVESTEVASDVASVVITVVVVAAVVVSAAVVTLRDSDSLTEIESNTEVEAETDSLPEMLIDEDPESLTEPESTTD